MGRLFVSMILVTCAGPLAGQTQKSAQSGEATFQQYCQPCHGPDGRAQTEMGRKVGAADLTSSKVQQDENGQFVMQIRDGKGKMPAFGDKLGDKEIQAVIEYVRTLGKR